MARVRIDFTRDAENAEWLHRARARRMELRHKENPDPPPKWIPTPGEEGGEPSSRVAASKEERAARIKKVAAAKIAEYKAIEPEATATMQRIAADTGGELAGLDFRLKSESSLERKIGNEAASLGISEEEAAADINDTLRYTVVLPEDRFAEGAAQAQARLAEEGWQPRRAKLFFGGDLMYQGYNTVVENPETGHRMEVQYHTPQTLETKEVIHKAYERYRTLPEDDPEALRLRDEMRAAWKGFTPPPGWDRLPGEKQTRG